MKTFYRTRERERERERGDAFFLPFVRRLLFQQNEILQVREGCFPKKLSSDFGMIMTLIEVGRSAIDANITNDLRTKE
jgi:hypothetical protein